MCVVVDVGKDSGPGLYTVIIETFCCVQGEMKATSAVASTALLGHMCSRKGCWFCTKDPQKLIEHEMDPEHETKPLSTCPFSSTFTVFPPPLLFRPVSPCIPPTNHLFLLYCHLGDALLDCHVKA